MRKIAHWFIPHPTTHEKAKLLSWHFLLIYFLTFALLRVGFDLVSIYKPGVLGIDSQIKIEEVVAGTNRERQKMGLPHLTSNPALEAAARAKAANMFEENYWAHYSPSGKDPWGFIRGEGYKFSYAGENLARNFYNSEDMVTAWMNSPTHRENILNSNYEEIGIAVVEGVLQGQKTTLVVQMFGRSGTSEAFVPKVDLKGVNIGAGSPIPANSPYSVAGSSSLGLDLGGKTSLDPFAAAKTVGGILISFIAFLLAIDFMVLKKRGVFRLSSHHFAHLSFLAIAGAALVLSKAGEIF